MSDSRPFFSILIPSFNRPGFISQAIESIIANTFNDFEIIVSDDRSPRIDEIKKAINPFIESVKFIELPANIGMSNNWNYLVEQARGRYILIMGDDDILLKKTLSRLKQYILEYPNHDLFAFGFNVVDENNLLISTRKSPKLFEISCECDTFLKDLLVFDVIPFWTFHPFSICYRREIGDTIKYNKKAHNGADLLFLIECMNAGEKLLIIPEVFFSWRKIQKEDNRGGSNLSKGRINDIIARYNIIKILGKRNNLHPKIKQIVFDKQYEKKFLLDTVINCESIDKPNIMKLFQVDCHLVDAINKPNRVFLNRIVVSISRLKNYIKIFGFSGFFYILWFLWQRAYNKTRPSYPA